MNISKAMVIYFINGVKHYSWELSSSCFSALTYGFVFTSREHSPQMYKIHNYLSYSERRLYILSVENIALISLMPVISNRATLDGAVRGVCHRDSGSFVEAVRFE